MPLPALATALRVPALVLERIVAESQTLVAEGPTVRDAGFVPRLEGTGELAWDAARSTLRAAGFAAPRRGELGLDEEVWHALIRGGSLVPVGDDLAYLPETLDAMVTAAAGLGDGFSVGEFRDALVITRKHAVPLLEWMDGRGITRRTGAWVVHERAADLTAATRRRLTPLLSR
jgi:selenocysteine-specific elongation factor